MNRQPKGMPEGGQFAAETNAESTVLLAELTKDETLRTRDDAFLESTAGDAVEHFDQWMQNGVDVDPDDNWELWSHADVVEFYDNFITILGHRRQHSAEMVARANVLKQFES